MGESMVYVKWFLFLIPSLLMDVLGRLLAPVLPAFADESGYLPKWLWWFQTPDNALDGDRGHWERWPKSGDFWTYVRRVAWLLRNCAYGFNISVIGFKHKDGDRKEIYGDPDIGDKTGISGFCKWLVYRQGKLVAFQVYYVKHYKIFGVWKCVRAGFGWKVWGDPSGEIYGQYWVYMHPFKGSGLEDG